MCVGCCARGGVSMWVCLGGGGCLEWVPGRVEREERG